MRYWLSYIVGLILVIFSTLPFINFKVMAPGESFTWIFFVAGVATMYLLFLDLNPFIKAFAIYALFNAFVSAAPFISFLALFQLIAAVYFFYACTKVKNFEIIFRLLQAVFLLNAFMYLMQMIQKDPLTNFETNIYFGLTGQHMQSASFTVVLAAALIPFSRANLLVSFLASMFCNSAGAFISTAAGMSCYLQRSISKRKAIAFTLICVFVFLAWLGLSGKFHENMSLGGGRLGVWASTLNLGQQKLAFGWGIGTYQYIFPALGGINTIPWKTAHNDFIQIFFETGLFGIWILVCYMTHLIGNLIYLLRRAIFRAKAVQCLSGLLMISVNMLFAFPSRMIQCVLLIVFFLAYCQKVIDHGQE